MKRESVKRGLMSFNSVIKSYEIEKEDLIRLLCNNKIGGFVKDPHIDNKRWHRLHPDAAKGSYGTGSEFLLMLTREDDGSIGNFEREILWELVHFDAEEIKNYFKTVSTPTLKLFKSDFTHFIFAGVEYELSPAKAVFLEVLYKRKDADAPSLSEERLFELTQSLLEDRKIRPYESARLDNVLRNTPPLLNVVVKKPARATYVFAKHELIF